MISSTTFRKAFLEKIYFHAMSNFQREQFDQMKLDFVQTVGDLTDQPFCIHFRRNRKIHVMNFDLACDGMWMIKLILPQNLGVFVERNCIMSQSFNAPYSVERIVKTLTDKKFKVLEKNYKVEFDETTMATITRFVEMAEQAKSIAAIITSDYQHKLVVEFQQKFEKDSRLSLDELEQLFFGYSREAFHAYLTKYEFSDIPAVETLPEHTCATNPNIWESAYPLNGWQISSRPDGYGHECGSSIEISYNNRLLFRYGWSSDD